MESINRQIPAFFLCANTTNGFVSRLQELTAHQRFDTVYLLKGGPGSGKSTLLKRLADHAWEMGRAPQQILCSFDPASLDGLCVGRTAFLDATAPHCIEPQYLGALEQIVQLNFAQVEVLRERRTELIALTQQKQALYEKGRRYLLAAEALSREMEKIVAPAINLKKAEDLAARLAEKEFPPSNGTQGEEQQRLLGSFGPKGWVFLEDTVELYAKRVCLIHDEYGVVTPAMLAVLRKQALERGLFVISCFHPLQPFDRLEQLIIPALSLAFVTAGRVATGKLHCVQRMHWERFSDAQQLAVYKKRMSFSAKASEELLLQSQSSFAQAAEVHQRIEALYQPAMDYTQLEAVYQQLKAEIA